VSRLLIVDDDEMNRDVLTQRLLRRGYGVVSVTNGEEALAAAVSEKPDLILMDLAMPVLDGYEATRRLKSNPETASIPVIALSARAMRGDREKALEAGCDEYDVKPVEFARLLVKINGFLQPKEKD